MIVNQANLANLFVGYKAAFNQGFRDLKLDWPKIATPVPSSTAEEHYAWLGQFPQLREWIGDRVINGMSLFDYTIKNLKYEATLGVKRDQIEDDQYGILAPLFQEMGFSAATHPEGLIFKLLAAGFATPCYDGQYFFDTDHPVGAGVVANTDGGAGTGWYLLDASRALKPLIFQKRREYELRAMTQLMDERVFMSDEFRYGVDARCNAGFGFWQVAWGSKQTLDATHYAAARAALMGMQSDQGRPLGIKPGLLVVPPALEGAARTLLLLQYAAPGVINPWFGTADILVSPWLS